MKKYKSEGDITLDYLLNRSNLGIEQLADVLTERFNKIKSKKGKISRQAISAWVNGKHQPRLTPGEMLELCDVLGCTLLELSQAVKGSNQPEEN